MKMPSLSPSKVNTKRYKKALPFCSQLLSEGFEYSARENVQCLVFGWMQQGTMPPYNMVFRSAQGLSEQFVRFHADGTMPKWIQWSLALSIWLPNVWPVAFYIFYSMFAWWTVTTRTQTACQRNHSKNWGEVTQFSKQCCPMVRKLLICSTVAMLHAAPHRKPSWICKILSKLSNIPMLFLRDHRAKPRPGR